MIAAHIYRPLLVLGMTAAVALSAGCVSKDMTDLQDYASTVLTRKGGTIEPLPPIKPYERYLYQAAELNLRDPFSSFLAKEQAIEQVSKVTSAEQMRLATEILTHNREELENFELDGLRMVGILENTEYLWAIVRDQGGVVHRVTVGNYVGRNFGKVTGIEEDRIELREIIKDSQGNWEERPASLALSE